MPGLPLTNKLPPALASLATVSTARERRAGNFWTLSEKQLFTKLGLGHISRETETLKNQSQVNKMRLDHVVRLIATTDFMIFREIAMLTLRERGYQQVELRDGWKDGGSDVSVWTLPPNTDELAVQVTVQQQDWKSKLKTDAKKVAESLGLNRLIFITSKRIASVEWEEVADTIWASTGVQVLRFDGQGIASLVVERGLVAELLAILGIDPHLPAPLADPKQSIRDEVSFALSLLNPESRDFRRSVIETGVASVLIEGEGMERTDLARAALSASGLGENQGPLVESAIDRLLQSGDLQSEGGVLKLKESIRRTYLGSRDLRMAEWSRLGEEVKVALVKCGTKTRPTDADVQVVLGALGGLILANASSREEYLNRAIPHSKVRESVRVELREIHRVLDSMGFSEGVPREELFRELADIALGSDLAYHLTAGQFYIGLAAMDGSALSRALGSTTPMTVVLDSSVAIPLLAALVYQETPQEWCRTAKHMFDQAGAHRIELAVPMEYTEETAAHLVDAYRFYRPLVEEGVDLRGSDNGFVSHFSALVALAPDLEFGVYLRSLGLNEEALKKDFYAARDVAMRRHQALFHRYKVRVLPEARPSRASRAKAQEILEVSSYERGIDRPKVLLGHDK